MASDRALYTVAVAVLALGLGNSLATNQPEWLRGLADRSLMVAQQASGRAQGYLGIAQVLLGYGQPGFGRTQAVIGHMQAQIGSMQAQMGRRQAQITRVEAERVRVAAMESVSRMNLSCSRNIKLEIPQEMTIDTFDEP